MFEYFAHPALKAILLAQEEARRSGHALAGTEHLLLGLLAEGQAIAAQVLQAAGLTLAALRQVTDQLIGRGLDHTTTNTPFTPRAQQIFEQAFVEAHQGGQAYVSTEHLLLAIARDAESVAARILDVQGIDLGQLCADLEHHLMAEDELDLFALFADPPPELGAETLEATRSPFELDWLAPPPRLAQFSLNLTEQAALGRLDPLVGREREVQRVLHILGRRTKNNPLLVGEPGVGKSAIAVGLAQRIVAGAVPDALLDQQVVSLDLAALLAGTQFRGEFEARLHSILAEVRQAGNIILVIDEIHTLVGAGGRGGPLDAANVLKPALARGELQCLGTTTSEEYRQQIESDAALARRFQPVWVGEPTVPETIAILHGLRPRYEAHHRVTMTTAALEAAATLAQQYIPERRLPDKAIDLIDEAGSRVRVRRSLRSPSASGTPAEVTADDVAQIVTSWTGVPVTKLTEPESELLLHLEAALQERLIGQATAVQAVARAVRRARVGLHDPHRPLASFLFTGPTGVGKTALAQALATFLFGSEAALMRLDMSEYQEPAAVAKLIGAPPGYRGHEESGQLTAALRRRPYTLVLLEDIEKAHPAVLNLLLHVLAEGQLTDSQGRRVSFRNALIVMTSNLGSQAITQGGRGLGFHRADPRTNEASQHLQAQVQADLKQHFQPEFLNRLDEIILFQPLSRTEIGQIAERLLRDWRDRLLLEEGLTLEVSAAFTAQLVDQGYDPPSGARSVGRALTRLLADPLTEALLAGRVQGGQTVQVTVDAAGQVVLHAQAGTAGEPGDSTQASGRSRLPTLTA